MQEVHLVVLLLVRRFYNIEHVDAIMQVLEVYWREQGYDEVKLRQTSTIFCKKKYRIAGLFFI